MASTRASENVQDNALSFHVSSFKHVWATYALLKHIYMPTTLHVEITLEEIVVIKLTLLFYFVTSFKPFNSSNTMDNFKGILHNLAHSQNMSTSFIPEYSLTLPLEVVHPQHPCLLKICSVHDLQK